MTNEEIIQRGQLINDETEPAQNTSERVGGVIKGIGQNLADKDTAIAAQAARNGYYQCTVSGTTLAVTAPGFTLPAHGGNIRIKMSAPATGASTLNINGTGAKALLYNGADVSSTNTWEQDEIISVFYDPSGSGQYLASNSQGGGAGLKIKNATADLDINDDSNNTLVRFSDGHVKTKNFDSRNLNTFVGDDVNADFDISDDADNSIVRFLDGHIKTKYFDSRTVLKQSDISTLYDTLRVLNHPLYGKKVGFLGDSITYGYGLPESVRLTARYSSVLCNMIGCTEVNMGVSGTCIASNTLNNRNDTRFVTRVTQANIGDLDFLFVFGGTNDFSYDTKPIGEHFSINTITPPSNLVGSTQLGTVVDTETFSGGLHDLILAIRAINPNLPMCFLTPLSRGRYLNGANYTHGGVTYRGARPSIADSNINGNYLYEFEDAIVDITRFYAIPSIRTCSFFNNRATDDGASDLFQGSGDNIHLTVAGNERLAKLLFNWTMNNIVI